MNTTTKQRLSASIDPHLLLAAASAVKRGRAATVSAWVNDALRMKAEEDRRMEALATFIEDFEAEHGEITSEEMNLAVRQAKSRATIVRGRRKQQAGGPAATEDPMSLILDAGALVAIERGDRQVIALLKDELRQGRSPRTHGGVLGQAWRGGSGRQALLARLLPGLNVSALDSALGKRAGILMGEAGTDDVVDAALILLASDDDILLTTDLDDLAHLAGVADLQVDIVPV